MLGKLIRNFICSIKKHPRTKTNNSKMKLKFSPQVKGLKEISDSNKSLFTVKMNVPALKVKKINYLQAKRLLKTFTFDSVVNCKRFQDLDESHSMYLSHKYILLDPDTFKVELLDDKTRKELLDLLDNNEINKFDSSFEQLSIELDYSDFKFDDIMKAVIPDDLLNENVNVKSYSVIGHIAHFNLRDKILDYKGLIGNVLLEKIPNIKTVVNKLSEIDNTYRNFQFEVLAGIKDTLVEVKENGCLFRFDFANVYWNPRLGKFNLT